MLKGIPTEEHLARMYYELARQGASCVGEEFPWPYEVAGLEELFCLGAEMSRHDPRLFGILVLFLDQQWKRLNPLTLRSQYSRMSAPQTVAVMAEFLLGHAAPVEEKRRFLEYLQAGLHPVEPQLYYQHLYRPGGEMMQRAIDMPLTEYKRWGFLAREAPILDEVSRRTAGSRDAESRRNVLMRLLDERRRIRLAEYRAALGFSISRQQALLDLRSIKGVRLMGRGPGARWVRAASPQ